MELYNPNYMNVKQLTDAIQLIDKKLEDKKKPLSTEAQRLLKSKRVTYVNARQKILNYIKKQQNKGVILTDSKKNTLRLIDIHKGVKEKKAFDFIDELQNRRGFIVGIGSTATALCAANAISHALTATKEGSKGLMKVITDAITTAFKNNPAVAMWASAAIGIAGLTAAAAVTPNIKRAWERGNERKAARLKADQDFKLDNQEQLRAGKTSLDEYEFTTGDLTKTQLDVVKADPNLKRELHQIALGTHEKYKNVSPIARKKIIEYLTEMSKEEAEAQAAIAAYQNSDERRAEIREAEKRDLISKGAELMSDLDHEASYSSDLESKLGSFKGLMADDLENVSEEILNAAKSDESLAADKQSFVEGKITEAKTTESTDLYKAETYSEDITKLLGKAKVSPGGAVTTLGEFLKNSKRETGEYDSIVNANMEGIKIGIGTLLGLLDSEGDTPIISDPAKKATILRIVSDISSTLDESDPTPAEIKSALEAIETLYGEIDNAKEAKERAEGAVRDNAGKDWDKDNKERIINKAVDIVISDLGTDPQTAQTAQTAKDYKKVIDKLKDTKYGLSQAEAVHLIYTQMSKNKENESERSK